MKKYVRKDNKGKVIAGTVACTLLAGVGLMAIPQVNEPVADKLAEHCSPLYQSVVSENAFLKLTIEELQENKTELQGTITEIDNKLAEETDETKVKELNTQKTLVLEEIEKIDNRIAELETNQGGNSEYNIVITQIEQVNTSNGTVRTGYVSGETRTDRKTTIVENIIGGVVTNISLCDNLGLCDSEGHVLTQATDNYVSYTLSENIESSVYMYDINDRLISINDLVEGKDYTFTIKVDKVVDENGVVVKADTCLYFNETIEEICDYLNYALKFTGQDANNGGLYNLYLNHSSLQEEGSVRYVITNELGQVCETGIANLIFLEDENRMSIVFVKDDSEIENIDTYISDTYDYIGADFDFGDDGVTESITFNLLTDNGNQDTGTEPDIGFENPDEEL